MACRLKYEGEPKLTPGDKTQIFPKTHGVKYLGWRFYRTDEPDKNLQAARYPERPSGAGGKSHGGTNAEVEE